MSTLGLNGAFILGSGRCGSTLLSDILKSHPDVLSLSEVFSAQGTRGLLPGRISGAAYWDQLARPTKMAQLAMTPHNAPREFLYDFDAGRFPPGEVPPLLIATLPHLTDSPDALFDTLSHIVPNYPVQPVEHHHAMLFDQLRARFGRTVWVERTGLSVMYARLMPRLFPAAKFVLMYRDGRDTVLSYSRFPAIWPMIWSWKWAGRFGPHVLRLDAPLGRSRALRLSEQVLAPRPLIRWMLRTPPSLADCAAFWSQAMLQALDEYAALPRDQKTFLRFEALTSNPQQEIARLAGFLGVSAGSAWLDAASVLPKALRPRWETLPAADQAALEGATAKARAAYDRTFS